MILCFILLMGQVMNAYGQAEAGPDTTICKGNCVTLGGSMDPSWCFHWTPHTGLSDPYVANPSACPLVTTVYTLTVTGPEFSWTSTDQVEVTVVVISDITFSVDPLPSDGSSQSQASATSSSAGTIIWSIEGNNLGASINSSGLITAGTQSGMITVRAKDALNPDCYVEAALCLGTGDDCCPEYTDVTKVFGPLSVTIPGGVSPVGPADPQGYCTYQCNAAINFQMEGVFNKTYALPGVTVSWKEKTTDPSLYKDVTLTWNGTYTAGTFGVIDARITQVSLTVNASGDLGGSVTFEAFLNEDKSLGGIAVLKSGLSGSFTYTYTTGGGPGSLLNGAGFSGVWNFNGISGFMVLLKKGNSIIASVTVGSFDANGNVNNATLTAVTPAVWNSNNFTLVLDQLSLSFNYSIPNNDIEFIGGTGTVTLGNVTNVQGVITLSLTFSPNNVNASVLLSNARAFNCEISGSLTADFDYEFNLQSIAGNDISAKHDEFEQPFPNIDFEIKDGELEKFSIGSFQVKFKKKITFNMTNASYSKAAGYLSFSAKVTLPTIEMSVTDFRISTAGTVTLGNLTANINQAPVTLNISIGWSTDQFQGSFSGTFSGGIAINGSVIIGATATFNYGHFSMQVATPGIPLGTSGLKAKSLAGEFGYNWKAPDGPGASGVPEQGTLTIGFGVGIADMADIVLIEGYIRLTLGSATQIYLQGDVKVTANPPHYFHGQLAIWYTLGSTSVSGTISSAINFPAATGNVVKFNTGNVVFSVNNNKWSVTSPPMSGKIFNEIDVNAGVDVWAWIASPTAITGTISGSMNWTYSFSYAYPSNFNPTSCTTADATDNWAGFGALGTLDLNLGGSISAQMNSGGIVGELTVQASANATLSIKWPCFITCGWDCVDTYTASVEGSVNIQKTSSSARIYGTVTFTYGNESQSGDIDVTI